MDYTQEELQQEYQDVKDECPEYSDPESYQYDLDWCMTLAITRLEREEEDEPYRPDDNHNPYTDE